jgi:hypothetical protein
VRARYTDTNPKAEEFRIKLLREAPVYKMLEIVDSLTRTVHWLSWQGICERYNNEPHETRLQRFVALMYGDKLLAERVIEALKKKGASAQ